MEEDFNSFPTGPDDQQVNNSNNLIQMIWQAISNPKGYRDFLDLSRKRFKRFIIIIMFIVTLMAVGLQIIVVIINVGGLKNFFKNKIPPFVVRDGEIISEETFDIRMGEFRIYFDAREDSVSTSDLKDGYTYITIGRKRVNVLTQGANGRYFSTFTRNISSFFRDGMNNDTLVSLTPAIYISIIVAFILRMLLFVLKYWILALIYGMYARGLNMAIGNIHTDQEITRICLVAQTLGILLVNFNKAIGLPLPGFLMSAVGVFLTIRRISLYFSNYIGDKGLNV